ncbi:MAG TPA: MlaD family protein [Candidatus Angelobacter sp.]|nr:MlaD family protein [Candidatus Angelobacter sp.]
MPRKPRFNPLRLGIAVSVVMLLVVAVIVLSGIPGGPTVGLPWNKAFTVKAVLSDADSLSPKAGVQIAGVKIGEVHTVDLQNGTAVVSMDIQPQYSDIHTDAHVLLRPHGLFGPKYIELTPGTSAAPLLHDGDTIPGSQAVLPVDLDQVLQELQANEQHQLTTAIVEFGKAAAGRGSDFNQLVAAGNTLSQVLVSPLKSLDSVSTNLSDMFVQDEAFNSSFAQVPLDKLVEASNVSLKAFADTSAQLGDLLRHADTTLSNLDAALNGEAGNIRKTLEQAPGVIDQLNQFSGYLATFTSALNGSNPAVLPRSLLTDPANDPLSLGSAIENPLSALSSSDGKCNPPRIGHPEDFVTPPNGTSFCSFDGTYHYIRVQNLGNNNNPQSGAAYLPGSPDTASQAALQSNGTANAGDLISFGALIGF